jgi:hypothetical protein
MDSRENFGHIDKQNLVITKQSDFSLIREWQKPSCGVDRTQNRQIWSKRDMLRRFDFSTDVYETRLRLHRDRHVGICIGREICTPSLWWTELLQV